MDVTYRQGRKEDCQEIAKLDYIAADGAIEYLFHDLVPSMTATEILANGLAQDVYPHTFKSTIVAEYENQIIGMALSYPAKFHCITDELKSFLPEDRLAHFKDFYSSRVEGSYLLDAIAVDNKYRQKGIGKALLERTRKKALDEGYSELSLIVFADNKTAISFYNANSFKYVKAIDLKSHKLIPHESGCILMKCPL